MVSGGTTVPDPERVRAWLAEVVDPEIPVLTIDDLGVLRAVEVAADGTVVVTITPTYSGCPAMDLIRSEIRRVLKERGVARAEVRTVLSPAWTTDWLGPVARQKLADSGIAPPGGRAGGHGGGVLPVELGIRCPRCGSTRTRVVSRFGATACRQLRACADCLEPFDHFRAI